MAHSKVLVENLITSAKTNCAADHIIDSPERSVVNITVK